jgi:hypothetical protein
MRDRSESLGILGNKGGNEKNWTGFFSGGGVLKLNRVLRNTISS